MRILNQCVAAALIAVACAACAAQPDFDLVIAGGTVIDGTGVEPRRADVGIKGDRIAAVGNLSARSSPAVIDVTGKVVAPGFINLLSQSGVILLADGLAEGDLRQGVTTEILGANSPAFWTRTTQDEEALRRHAVTLDWTGLGGYFQKLEARGTAMNVGTFAPLSVADQSMPDGAFGVTDDAADSADVTAAARAVGRNNGVLVVRAANPIAGSDDALFAAGMEARRVLISDLTHPATSVADVIGRMVRASQRGIAMYGAAVPAPQPADDVNMRDALRYGGVIVAADNAAAFPRLLGQMVRDAHAMELREAIRRSTSLPASVLRLPNRGIVREGWFADLVVFDAATIADRATAGNPNQSSAGIDYVIVNGVVVLTPKGLTGARPGYAVSYSAR